LRLRAITGLVYSRMRRISWGDLPAISLLTESLREGRKRHWPETHNEDQEVTLTGLYDGVGLDTRENVSIRPLALRICVRY